MNRFITSYINKVKHIPYIVKHKIAFLKVEKQLLGKNTLAGFLHDTDKILLLLLTPLSKKRISKLHRKFAKHHINKNSSIYYIKQAIIDWECARYTKPDKPLTARETLDKYHPELKGMVIPVLEELGL